ncbi:MAG: cation acetate symporter [Pseudonocardia sp.]|uniref:sodium/solute symporter n=1 Tax=Pseudonocardia sp. TaxID=60912 RepID=UPI002639DF40|nr:cation acetate symporter [Pseudonocardia sp.]MCU1628482.1 cation acetate symporter [Pseudonocardia sp.]MDT7697939.1 cation/acetate symporter [Pseudonocardiales bacterium]HEV7472150.1 cation acetate symporter [Pseudonocardia sp.]
MIALAALPVILATLLIGARGVATLRSTSDFLVASRRISPTLNAAAVSGEYLSAASFLGVAGLVVKNGVGALWYPVGFTAGYLLMLVLVAAPMRRTGALTVPDFAEARLGSPRLRRFSALVVLVIAGLYLVPQFTAAGQVLTVVGGTPYWVGVVVAGASVAITLALGGMRAATYVQAFQFVLKLVLFIVPAVWLLLAVGADTRREALHPAEYSRFPAATEVQFRLDTRLEVGEPITVLADGVPRTLGPGEHVAPEDGRWVFPAGGRVPEIRGVALPGSELWQRPLLDNGSGHPLLATWSVLVATALGTMGLPHVIVRFHTNPDGRAARRTAAITVGLLGTFYLFPAVYGLLGGILLPELYLSGATDTAVVALPSRVDGGVAGTVFTALLTAGAFAAFLATSLGLVLALAGAVAHDLLPGGLRRLRVSAIVAAAVVVPLALLAVRIDVGAVVTSAFAVAASTFCPLLVLGIWWRRLTPRGAFVGMTVGLLSSAGVMGTSLVLRPEPGLTALLLGQPALWSVPLAFLTMVLVSLADDPPPGAESTMLRLHLDETRTP